MFLLVQLKKGNSQWVNSGVTRICCEKGQSWRLCHGALTVDFRTGCSNCSATFVTNAVLIERAVSCWHLHQLISQSQTTQISDSWLSDLLHSELKMKLLEVEGGTCRAPVPHSWRRHCEWIGYALIHVKVLSFHSGRKIPCKFN